MDKEIYCVQEIYERFLPADTSPLFDTKPEYSTQFDTKEEAEKYCEKYNNEHDGEWPQLRPKLMTDGDMKAWKEQQEYEYQIFDRL